MHTIERPDHTELSDYVILNKLRWREGEKMCRLDLGFHHLCLFVFGGLLRDYRCFFIEIMVL